MHTRVSKQKLKEFEDSNSLAARIVAQTTGQPTPDPLLSVPKEKNAAAVALGMLGASKGGIARAASLSAGQRSKIAKKAAKSRWNDKNQG